MPRFFYFGALLGIAAILCSPICAQTPAAGNARVQHVMVRGTSDAMEVEIQTSGALVEPDTQAITGPDRIIVDFPGALPDAELRALKVNRGALRGIRAGLFFNNPPITRVVLDLAEPQSYRIAASQNAIVVKLGPVKPGRVTTAGATAPGLARATLQNASMATSANVAVSAAVSSTPVPAVSEAPPPPPKPAVTVTFENGMLRIHAEKATLAQVLFEVQRETRAEIAIPAGAEQEQVVADLGPAPARDVLAALLNGSAYNFIFVGEELTLERVILTRRDPNSF
ncbi:MAG: AMIN domain-containing protein [Acidobacteriia bacterium]|nr:AMIN domain-containing protein [Terriglobia bacterium]